MMMMMKFGAEGRHQ